MKYLANLPERYDQDQAYDRYRTAREASVDALIETIPIVRSLLTPAQYRKLPTFVTPFLDKRYLASVRSGTSGLGLGVMMMPGGMVPAAIGDGARVQIIMRSGTP